MTLKLAIVVATLGVLLSNTSAQSKPLAVVATTADLGALARAVGGPDVLVTVLAKPAEDPHFVEAKPSFVRNLAAADLFLLVGFELEVGWAPTLIKSSRNPAVRAGAPGHVDCSEAVTPRNVPTGKVDRAQGDIHAGGNPHYLSDPIAGLKVAGLLRDRFAAARPEQKAAFEARHAAFAKRIGAALVGPKLAAKYDVDKLALLFEHQKLGQFLEKQGEGKDLAGWLGSLSPYAGTLVVADHDLWPYFAARFGLVVHRFLEPKPGIPPTTRHLAEVIEAMKDRKIGIILATPYFDPRHAEFAAGATGAKIVRLAHQTGALGGGDDYVDFVDQNVRRLVGALGEKP